MERIDMESRDQCLKMLRERYIKARKKKEKTEMLDEYCRNTGQARKYVIWKMQSASDETGDQGKDWREAEKKI